MMKVLGYNGGLDGYPGAMDSCHDSAAALVIDGVVVAACEEERFSREKHSGKFPRLAIDYVLREGGVRLDEIDLVTYYYSYPLMFDWALLSQNRHGLTWAERVCLWSSIEVMQTWNRV